MATYGDLLPWAMLFLAHLLVHALFVVFAETAFHSSHCGAFQFNRIAVMLQSAHRNWYLTSLILGIFFFIVFQMDGVAKAATEEFGNTP